MMWGMRVGNRLRRKISVIVRLIIFGLTKFMSVAEIVQDMPILMLLKSPLLKHVHVLITLIGMIRNLFVKLTVLKSTIQILTVSLIHQNVSVETHMTGYLTLLSAR